MDISTLSGVSPAYLNTYTQKTSFDDDNNKTNSFDSILSAMMQSVDETNDLQNKAASEEIRFALGESDNTHDLLIAETKANIALQYTVAVRDKLVDGYKELMQMSV